MRPLATIIIGHVDDSVSCRATQTYKLQTLSSIVDGCPLCLAGANASRQIVHIGGGLHREYPTCPPTTNKTNHTSECTSSTPPPSKKTRTKNRTLQKSRLVTGDRTQHRNQRPHRELRRSKDWHHDHQRVRMPGHHCLPSASILQRHMMLRHSHGANLHQLINTNIKTPIGSRTCRKF